MKTRKRFVAWVFGLASALAILPMSAQVPRDARGQARPEQRSQDNGEDGKAPAGQRAVHPWAVDWDQAGVVRIATGGVREAQAWDRPLADMQRAGELRPGRLQEDSQIAGRQHQRFDQYYRGIPVFAGGVVSQMDGQRLLSVFGTLYSGIALDVTPALTADQAGEVFAQETGQRPVAPLKPELMVLPRDDGSFVLVYRVTHFTGTALPVLFVNALTGAVEERYNNLQTQSPAIGSGLGVLGDQKKVSATLRNGVYVASDAMRPPAILTYDLKGNFDRAVAILYETTAPTWSDVATTSDNGNWADPAVVDAHAYLGWVYDYYFKRFGRRGLDNNNTPLRAIVHAVRREDSWWRGSPDVYEYLVNAFWCPACGSDHRGYLMLGDGTPSGSYYGGDFYKYLSGALDIVGHEVTHGVTSYTSDLVYLNESGALNEAFSDIMGTSMEFFFQPAGNGPMKADYLIGEDVITAATSTALTGIRSLADPLSFGDPDHYSLRYRGTQDNGGVHTNMSIASHAFYLAIEGGTNRTSRLAVQGVAGANREQIERIFYRAFTYYLPASATFSTARAATIRAAQDLYGAGSPAERAVTQAWSAVGVF